MSTTDLIVNVKHRTHLLLSSVLPLFANYNYMIENRNRNLYKLVAREEDKENIWLNWTLLIFQLNCWHQTTTLSYYIMLVASVHIFLVKWHWTLEVKRETWNFFTLKFSIFSTWNGALTTFNPIQLTNVWFR